MICPKCKTINSDDSKFCKNCAFDITSGNMDRSIPSETLDIPASALKQGTMLSGRYEILEKIGEGGMGEVYRATDKNLDRPVAIKILTGALAEDSERLARFEREAKLLAALNHTNIASIFGLEKSSGILFIVMEMVAGESLRSKLGRAPLDIQEALETCHQICEGLEAAHDRGIIHRDLKPENIMISPEGKVKILDFGLAKAYVSETTEINLEQSPTITAQMTKPGIIMGTAAYMSPEQARSRSVDKKTDIWAFGCVLYECLSGKKAFHGETVSDTIAHILKGEPEWTNLPLNTPGRIRALLRRCLQKNSKQRLHDIADARIEIEETLANPETERASSAASSSRWSVRFWVMAGLFIVVSSLLFWKIFHPSRSGPEPVLHLAVDLPETAPLAHAGVSPLGVGRSTLALSPDGSKLVYTALVGDDSQLFVRRMDQDEISQIPGTAGSHSPFFSPDGNWLGFFADEMLKKVSISGGAPEVLCAAPLGFGGTWGDDDNIYFVPRDFDVIWKVSSAGGAPQPLIADELQEGRPLCLWPELLPGGDSILFTNRGGGISVYSLRSGEIKRLLEGGIFARYSPTGHIVFGERGKLSAVPFHPGRLEVTGLPVTILEGIKTERIGLPQYTFSKDGLLVYAPGTNAALGTLTWVTRGGKSESLRLPLADYATFKLSPDGDAVALTINEPNSYDIWIYNLEKETLTRFTNGQSDYNPIWTPDGEWIYFVSQRDGTWQLYKKPADGSLEAEKVTSDASSIGSPVSFSPDGNLISYYRRTSNLMDLGIYSISEGGKSYPFLETPFFETQGSFSPDGRWISYTSDESGRWEVYVRPYPGPGRKYRVSLDGGEEARWSQNGKEIFFRFGNKWMAAGVNIEGEFRSEKPQFLFEGPYINIPGYSYDVSPDGRRFLVLEAAEQESKVRQLHVITNWFEKLIGLTSTMK